MEKVRAVNEQEKEIKKMADFTSPEALYKELISSVKKYQTSLLQKKYANSFRKKEKLRLYLQTRKKFCLWKIYDYLTVEKNDSIFFWTNQGENKICQDFFKRGKEVFFWKKG